MMKNCEDSSWSQMWKGEINMMNEMRTVVKGEVYWANIPKVENSQIQSGVRPVIIMCNKMAGIYSPVVQYIPVTSKTEKMKRKMLPTHILLRQTCPHKDSVALAEQLGCIDKHRLMEKICDLSDFDVYNIDIASGIQLGNRDYNRSNRYAMA